MQDRVLIDLLIDATLPRIRQLTMAMYAQARLEASTADEIVATLKGPGVPSKRAKPLDEATQVAVDEIWRAPLSSACVSLLRGIATKATNGVFRIVPASVDDVLRSLDLSDLRRRMGVHEDDLRLVLPQVGAALQEVVRDQGGQIKVPINRKEILLIDGARPGQPERPR